MKKYIYVGVKIGSFFGTNSTDYRYIIDEYAERGYRYVGFVPTRIVGYGRISEIDLIFEIDA